MRSKLSLRKKYSLWLSLVSLAILILVILSVLAVLWKGADTLKRTLKKETRETIENTQLTTMRNLSEYVRLHLAPFLYRMDIEETNKLIRNLRKGMQIRSFRVADASGKVLTDGMKENPSFGMVLPLSEQALKREGVLIETTPEGFRATFWIGMEGYTIGYGEIIFSGEPLQKVIAQQEEAVVSIWQGYTETFLTITVVGVLCIAFITVAFSVVFSKTFSGPLVRLRDATTRIAQGDLRHRVEVASDDEIGELAGSFNRMVDELQKRTEELGETNRALEDEIQERALIGKVLEEEKERLAVTLHSIGDGVIATDIEGRVMLMNPAAEKLTGFGQSEALGKPIRDVFRIYDEETDQPLEDPVAVVLRSGRDVESPGNRKFVDKSGIQLTIAHSCAPIRNTEEGIIGTVLVFRDRTERRMLEKELLKAQKLESVGVLAGGIAHDFNNLLTGILGNISLAKLYAAEGSGSELLEEAEKATLRATELTKQLLTFSKGGAPVKKAVSISEMIVDSCQFVLRGSNVKCEFSLSAELWPAEADEGQINQVLHNLIMNADQSMPEGGIIGLSAENIVVGPENRLPLKAGRYIKLRIKDEGVGILKEHLPKIFDPYFTTKEKGEGLGLATTYSIVKNHHGHISAESAVGIGTAFTLYLPASEGSVSAGKNREEQVLTGKGCILVMDDDPVIQALARAMLNKLGYEVAAAGDGKEAIALFRSARESGRPFDAVLMDLTIPGGMGGKETIQHLLAIDRQVKAIVSSGYSNDPIMANYREYGFSGVAPKPYTLQLLSAAVHAVLGQPASESASKAS